MIRRTAAIAALFALAAAPAQAERLGPASAASAEAERDYGDVGHGRRHLHELTHEEIRALIVFRDYLIARGTDTRSARERCYDQELARLNGMPTYLALRSIDLKCSQR